MITTVTPEQFWGAIPGYVERAHHAATCIIEHALSDPTSGIQLQATVFSGDAPDYRAHVLDPERVAELWGTRQGLQSLEADVPIEGGRLAIDDSLGKGRPLRAWVYTPDLGLPLPQLRTENLAADRIEEGGEEAEREPERQRTDWTGSGARAYLGNLSMMPGYIFSEGHGTIGGTDEDRPHMFAYVYSSHDAQAGRDTFHSASGIDNVTADRYRDALAPPYTAADAELLEGHNLQTYHTTKIEMLLAIMGGVALA